MKNRRPTISVIEDEPDLARIEQINLEQDGFDVVVGHDGATALALIRRASPDLVLLDVMLPGINGIEVCRQLKSDHSLAPIPVIIVSARGDETDVVLGLSIGADDYMTKPFRPRELVARVRAVLRRTAARTSAAAGGRIERDGVTIDIDRREVSIDGELLVLTATEFRLLHVLASNPGRVFTRDQLLDRAIGERRSISDRNVDVHVRGVRRKLGAHSGLIETVRGFGYRFRDELR